MSTATIPRFASDAAADEVSAALRDHGVVIIERLADAALCDRSPRRVGTVVGGDTDRRRRLRRPQHSAHRRAADPLPVERCDGRASR